MSRKIGILAVGAVVLLPLKDLELENALMPSCTYVNQLINSDPITY